MVAEKDHGKRFMATFRAGMILRMRISGENRLFMMIRIFATKLPID